MQIDWIHEGEKSSDTTKAVRALSGRANTYKTDTPFTLPAKVPQEIQLTFEILKPNHFDFIEYSKVSFNSSEKTMMLISKIESQEDIINGINLRVKVTNLNAAFLENKSLQGDLKIELYSRSQKVANIIVSLRTPPSLIEMKEYHLSELKEQGFESLESYFSPIINNQQLNVIRLFKIKNNHEIDIDVTVSKNIKARLYQKSRSLTYAQQKCAYSYYDTPFDEDYSSKVAIFPLDEKFILESHHFIKNTESFSDSIRRLSPQQEIVYGVFALGVKANDWMKLGPYKSETQQVSINISCKKECTWLECEGGKKNGFNTLGFELAACVCNSWKYHEIKGNIMVGTIRDAVFLDIENTNRLVSLRFADLEKSQDFESRYIEHFKNHSEIFWF